LVTVCESNAAVWCTLSPNRHQNPVNFSTAARLESRFVCVWQSERLSTSACQSLVSRTRIEILDRRNLENLCHICRRIRRWFQNLSILPIVNRTIWPDLRHIGSMNFDENIIQRNPPLECCPIHHVEQIGQSVSRSRNVANPARLGKLFPLLANQLNAKISPTFGRSLRIFQNREPKLPMPNPQSLHRFGFHFKTPMLACETSTNIIDVWPCATEFYSIDRG